MIEADKRKAIFLLHQEGMSVREIARRLGVSRNSVRAVIRQKGAMPQRVRKDKIRMDPELLRRLYEECAGWKQRVHERLVEEEGMEIKYSTLTRLLRDLGIGPVQKVTCDRVADKPGVEMQHDTTPYQVMLGEKRVRVVASLLYLRYSKRRYLKFYRTFNRFCMKCFFHETLMSWGYAARECIIDNTNLARLRGSGRDALMVPEMEAFSKQYGFHFLCHEKGHANRKAGEERSFFTVETNFFPGRRFQSLEDMNEQAFQWATVRMYHRPVSKSGLIPAEAFEHERAFLIELPAHLPAPYLVHERLTDQYGYAAFDGNYYWVPACASHAERPGTKREDVRVLQYGDHVEIYRGRERLCQYPLPADGVKNERFSPEGLPRPRCQPKNRRRPAQEEEKRLRGMGDVVAAYLDFALTRKGVQRNWFVRELFALAQQMTASLFIRAIQRGLHYRITSVGAIRRIALLYMNQGAQRLPYVEVDEGFRERDAYREGQLSDEPDFSVYEEMLEEKEEGEEEDG